MGVPQNLCAIRLEDLPWAFLARPRRKFWVLRLIGRHGGAVNLPLSGLVRVHAERGVLPAVNAGLVSGGGGGHGGFELVKGDKITFSSNFLKPICTDGIIGEGGFR